MRRGAERDAQIDQGRGQGFRRAQRGEGQKSDGRSGIGQTQQPLPVSAIGERSPEQQRRDLHRQLHRADHADEQR